MSLPEGAYVAVEGVIGVGKTSLTHILGKELRAEVILEAFSDNPYLENFYKDRAAWAFQTQLHFLLARHRQQASLKQRHMFRNCMVSDYLFEKDRLFARVNLSDREYTLYCKIADFLQDDIMVPDLVVYLKASPERLKGNVLFRNREVDRDIEIEYLADLCTSYNQMFDTWTKSPLLIVNATNLEFVRNEKDRNDLIKAILEHPGGTQYYEPTTNHPE